MGIVEWFLVHRADNCDMSDCSSDKSTVRYQHSKLPFCSWQPSFIVIERSFIIWFTKTFVVIFYNSCLAQISTNGLVHFMHPPAMCLLVAATQFPKWLDHRFGYEPASLHQISHLETIKHSSVLRQFSWRHCFWLPLTRSDEYCCLNSYSNCSYKVFASGPCMAKWKSGLFPFSRLYKVNWLTHNTSNSISLTFFCHRFPAEFSNRRILNNFRALKERMKTF